MTVANKKGYFITVEGTDGAGKTSVLATIENWITAQGHRVITTREPGGTPLAEQIRDLLLTSREEKLADDAELLMMMAARVQHVHTKIKPALMQGTWVLSDRFLDASYAYQGGGRGMSTARIDALHTWAIDHFLPDLTILLDVPVAIGQARVAHRGEEKTRFEEEKTTFFERVRSAYLARANQEPQRIVVIDARADQARVQADVIAALSQRWSA
jgi:dTMP kinase